MKYEINYIGTVVWIFLIAVACISLEVARVTYFPVVSAELSLASVNGGAANYAAQRTWVASEGLGLFFILIFAAVTIWPLCISKTKT